jgi:hypothetical protein
MAHSPDKKIKLRAAYIGGLPLEAAADKVGVPLPTARNWYRADKKDGDDWDAAQRMGLVVAGGGMEEAMGRITITALLRCEKLLETPDDDIDRSIKAMSTLADTMSKLQAANRHLMPAADKLAIETAAIKRFAELFARHHPADAGKMVAVLELFARGQ